MALAQVARSRVAGPPRRPPGHLSVSRAHCWDVPGARRAPASPLGTAAAPAMRRRRPPCAATLYKRQAPVPRPSCTPDRGQHRGSGSSRSGVAALRGSGQLAARHAALRSLAAVAAPGCAGAAHSHGHRCKLLLHTHRPRHSCPCHQHRAASHPPSGLAGSHLAHGAATRAPCRQVEAPQAPPPRSQAAGTGRVAACKPPLPDSPLLQTHPCGRRLPRHCPLNTATQRGGRGRLWRAPAAAVAAAGLPWLERRCPWRLQARSQRSTGSVADRLKESIWNRAKKNGPARLKSVAGAAARHNPAPPSCPSPQASAPCPLAARHHER